jgi:uncharacterized RDD family membrane protein YckC
MDSEQYTIRGITGVDVNLPLAGPGSRSYAFIIDWHIRVLLVLAWLAALLLIEQGRLSWPSNLKAFSSTLGVLLTLVPLLLYFFYHPVLEILMRGQSPGKRIAGVRIVTVDGGTPGVGAILIRNIFRLIDCLPAFYVVGFLTTFFSAQHVRIGDMAAGTLLVVDEEQSMKHLERELAPPRGVDYAALDLAQQILDRWSSLAVEKRDAIARSFLKKVSGQDAAEELDDAALHARLSELASGPAAS